MHNRCVALAVIALVAAVAPAPPEVGGSPASAATPQAAQSVQTAQTVRQTLAATDAQLTRIAHDIDDARSRLSDLQARRGQVESDLAAARSRRDQAARDLRRVAIQSYMHSSDNVLSALVSDTGPGDLALRVSYAGRIVHKEADAIDAFRQATADVGLDRRQLDELVGAAQARLAELNARQAALVAGQLHQRQVVIAAETAPATTAARPASVRPGSAAPSAPPAVHVRPVSPGAAPVVPAGQETPAPIPPSTGASGPLFVITCYSGTGHTATGTTPHVGTAAVDPSVIPMGSHFRIDGLGTFTAEDTGGAVHGNRIDIWNPSDAWCRNFGRRSRAVTLL